MSHNKHVALLKNPIQHLFTTSYRHIVAIFAKHEELLVKKWKKIG